MCTCTAILIIKMKTQIKKWGDSKVLVLSADFMNYHQAKVGDWVDISDALVIGLYNSKKEQMIRLKERFPIAYESHIKEHPEDKLE